MAVHSRLESPARPGSRWRRQGRATLGPLALPYRLGAAASFGYTGFSGRALAGV
jgi:hypothetical protein